MVNGQRGAQTHTLPRSVDCGPPGSALVERLKAPGRIHVRHLSSLKSPSDISNQGTPPESLPQVPALGAHPRMTGACYKDTAISLKSLPREKSRIIWAPKRGRIDHSAHGIKQQTTYTDINQIERLLRNRIYAVSNFCPVRPSLVTKSRARRPREHV